MYYSLDIIAERARFAHPQEGRGELLSGLRGGRVDLWMYFSNLGCLLTAVGGGTGYIYNRSTSLSSDVSYARLTMLFSYYYLAFVLDCSV